MLKQLKIYSYDDEDTPFISKQKEMFNELVEERIEKITDLDERVNNNNLIYKYKKNIDDVNLNESDHALDIINKIRDGKKELADVKNNQQKFKSFLGKIKK